MNLNVKYALPIVLAGDFNSRTGLLDDFINDDPLQNIDLNDFIDECLFSSKRELEALNVNTVRYNSDIIVNNHGRNLIELCKMLDIKIVNGRFGMDSNVGNFTCFTPNGKSSIDYFIVSPKLMSDIADFSVETFDSCLSDTHSALCMELRLRGICDMNPKNVQDEENIESDGEETNETNNFEYEELKSKWSNDIKNEYLEVFSSGDMSLLIQKLDTLDPINITQSIMDDIVKDLGKLLIDPAKYIGICKAFNQNKPKAKAPKRKSQPWFDKECNIKRAEYMRIKNRLKKIKTEEARREMRAKAKIYKKIIRKARKSFRKKFHRNIRKLKKSNSKDYWDLLKNADKNDMISKIALKTFRDHFAKLSLGPISNNERQQADSFDPRNIRHSINEDLNQLFTVNEIKTQIKRLKSRKACGIDNIINEFLKNCPPDMLTIITRIFNIVLISSIVPYCWCIGMIQPIFKRKGSPDDPDNYRGITLLSCVAKLYCLYQ